MDLSCTRFKMTKDILIRDRVPLMTNKRTFQKLQYMFEYNVDKYNNYLYMG